MKKKLTALFLALVMCMTLGVPAFATDGSRPHVTCDNEMQRVVEAICGDDRLVTTCDKATGVVTISRYSVVTGELLASAEIPPDSDIVTEMSASAAMEETNELSLEAANLSNSTMMGYAYSVYYSSPISWSLSCPQYANGNGVTFSFACEEYSSYAANLQEFRENVDDMQMIEDKMTVYVKESMLLNIITGCILASGNPAAFAAAFESYFVNQNYIIAVQEYAIEYGGYQNDAYDNYWRVHSAWSDLASLPPVEAAA